MKPIFNRYTPAYQEIYENGYPDEDKDPDYYESWWETQIRRCIGGYEPVKGDYICGDYYFHLNFAHGEVLDPIRKDKPILQFPYNDCDHELSDFLWQCEEDGVGAIIMKGRRARFTTIVSSKLLARWTFSPGTSLGVGTWVKDQHDKVFDNIEIMRAHVPDELKLIGKYGKDKEILEATERIKTKTGGFQKEGLFSKIHFVTFGGVKRNVGAFRGKSLKIALFDEIGENPHLNDCRMASEECWKEGEAWYGLPIFGGTSNMMKNPDPFLRQFVYSPEVFNCRVHFIPRQRFYYSHPVAYYDIKTGIATPQQQEKARLSIKKRGDELYNLENKSSYYGYLQENPTTLDECFLGNSMSEKLPMDQVNARLKRMYDDPEWDSQIRKYGITFPRGVFNPRNPEVDWDTITKNGEYHIFEMPQGEEYKNLYIAGVDTYYDSGAPNSPSVGVMYVFKRENIHDGSKAAHCFVAEYAARYSTNEAFYEGCLKLALAYSTPDSPCKILAEHDTAFEAYMTHSRALRYFKERPTTITGMTSINRYMIKMSGLVKTEGTALFHDFLEKYCVNIPFKRLLEDCKYFGVKNTDFCSAAIVTLIHNADVFELKVKFDDGKVQQNEDFFPTYTRQNGILSMNRKPEQQNDDFWGNPNSYKNFLNT